MQTGRTLVALVGASAALWLTGGATPTEVQWITSYEEARKAAVESGRLMMIDFYTDW